MNTAIIKPCIRSKFELFAEQGRILFFSAACGFGKSAVAKELLKSKNVYEASSDDDFSALPHSDWDYMLIDDFKNVQEYDEQQALLSLIRDNPNKRFVFLSRGDLPGWLMPFRVSGLLTEIGFEELRFGRSETALLFEKHGVSLSEADLTKIYDESYGYPLALSLFICGIQNGIPLGNALTEYVNEKIFVYYEAEIFNRFDMQMRRFLLSIAVFDEFTVELAKIASGDCHAAERLDIICRNTHMIEHRNAERFSFWGIFRRFLRLMMQKEYSEEQISSVYSRGGLYYELHENYGKALEYYSKSGDKSKVSELIIKSMYLHPGMGHYEELEIYFEMLPEEQIDASPALMHGMSMLRALQGKYDESEKWYGRLASFASGGKKSDDAVKEAKSRLIFLDISLPQRGVGNIARLISAAAGLIANKEIKRYAFSVTSALPSIMNGGKDFSKWSKNDDLLYATMRKPVEFLLGKDGVGLADCAIAESKFEKAKDNTVRILELASKLNEIQNNGTPDIEFAVVGLLARSQIFSGCADVSANTVNALRNRFVEHGFVRFLPNIDALLCRIALRTEDTDYVENWYSTKAPKDAVNIRIMKRYLYFTQAMTELSFGDNSSALLTLMPLESFFKVCERHIDMIHLKTLSAIAKYRMNDTSWKSDIDTAVRISAEYDFIRPVSGYGVSVLPLLEERASVEPGTNDKFTEALIKAARTQAVCYPNFMIPTAHRYTERLSEAELQVLKLLCADKSNAEISRILSIQITTVKSHISHILQKLGAKRRGEAKTIALNLKIV